MKEAADILCIGSVLWDVIGRANVHMKLGADVPGRITRVPGGVAMNIAMTLKRFGMSPALLSAVGQDTQGHELIETCDRLGLITDYVYRSQDMPTDRYMAVEGVNGLIAAVADAHSLENAGDKILRPLENGQLGSTAAPYSGLIALDGNLTALLLADIAARPSFGAADLRVAPASPGKAERLLPLLGHANTTLYVNLEEANLLCQQHHSTSRAAAEALLKRGASRVLVTNGGDDATDGSLKGMLSRPPPQVLVTRITGAGDTFMAAHIAAETKGTSREDALDAALQAAAAYVCGESET